MFDRFKNKRKKQQKKEKQQKKLNQNSVTQNLLKKMNQQEKFGKNALDHWRVEISIHWPNLASAILIWQVQF